MKRFLSLFLLAPLALFGRGNLEQSFTNPPDSARPWVYWYFMDGNISREGLTADLEAMKKAGIGGGTWLEVNIGVPRGPIDFMSPQWQDLFQFGVSEANRLGLEIALGTGPGWCGTGGPWVKPEQSMQHLVCSETNITGPGKIECQLPRPQPRTPYFGMGTLTPTLEKQWREFYEDVAVLAFPTPDGAARTADIDEKALYHRDPYSSKEGVKPFLPAPATFSQIPSSQCVPTNSIDLTAFMDKHGRLTWQAPGGHWTILRFGRTTTGQASRPAPDPGLGLECDKFDRAATDAHFDAFVGTLLKKTGKPQPGKGLTTLHFDSWEMSSQNWTPSFRKEFTQRRGYDPLPFFPAVSGRIVGSSELTERFLWDLRQTAQELVIENHAMRLKDLGHKHGLAFSLEPYDLNPCSDMELGGVADIPQCEFWSTGYGFSTEYSCFESTSIAHTMGRSIVAAEAFTANPGEDWKLYPGLMKSQADWALCCGINRLIFHRYQHQPALDRWPGMTMGPYGVHWERTQTWWDMVPAFHAYLSRCQALLQTGQPVSDILYLVPEGAPMVFTPPASALMEGLPDRRGHAFDACAPSTLLKRGKVKNGRLTFPDGASYAVLVLPRFETMTPKLLQKICELAKAGVPIIGNAPKKSPSLSGYPQCDEKVRDLASLWWASANPSSSSGNGGIIPDTDATPGLYPGYGFTEQILSQKRILPDFETTGNLRFIHRHTSEAELYFVGNRESRSQSVECRFRVTGRQPELWHPVTGERRILPAFAQRDGSTRITLEFAPDESYFVVFRKPITTLTGIGTNFTALKSSIEIKGPWDVAFDPRWGGPAKVPFQKLEDWTLRPEPGIRFYSGKAVYETTFDSPRLEANPQHYLSLGTIHAMASVKLNGQDLGSVWCPPWNVKIPSGLLRERNNKLEITVANLWLNRLIGDKSLPEDKRLTWTTRNPYEANTPLSPSGLIGPVTLDTKE